MVNDLRSPCSITHLCFLTLMELFTFSILSTSNFRYYLFLLPESMNDALYILTFTKRRRRIHFMMVKLPLFIILVPAGETKAGLRACLPAHCSYFWSVLCQSLFPCLQKLLDHTRKNKFWSDYTPISILIMRDLFFIQLAQQLPVNLDNFPMGL